MIYNPDTRMSIFSSWVFIAAVIAAWFACGLNKKQYDREGHLIEGAEAKSET